MFTIRSVVVSGMIIVWLLLIPSSHAQSAPIATPAQITVAGVRDEIVSRTILIRATSPISNIQAISTDLTSERHAVIEARVINTAFPTTQLQNGDIISATITIDLHHVAAGTYTGNLMLNTSDDTLVVPMTVQVKHSQWWAWLVLVPGVACGLFLTHYRRVVQPYDEVIIRAGRLRNQMHSDQKLANSFRDYIEDRLLDTEFALQGANMDQAHQAIDLAEATWKRWRHDRANWIEQFAYSEQLLTKLDDTLKEKTISIPYVERVKQLVQQAVRDAPTMDAGPSALETVLQKQKQSIEYYHTQYNWLNGLFDEITNNPELKQQAKILEKRLFALDPDDTSAKETLVQAIQTLEEKVGQQEGTGGRGTDYMETFFLRPVPLLAPVSTSIESAQRAFRRLIWARRLSSTFIFLLLILVGFGQLYGDNPTFGANFWTDYATLLAWGFGAETSRASLMELGKGGSSEK